MASGTVWSSGSPSTWQIGIYYSYTVYDSYYSCYWEVRYYQPGSGQFGSSFTWEISDSSGYDVSHNAYDYFGYPDQSFNGYGGKTEYVISGRTQ